MEMWKDIDGYNGIYQVSNLGRVKSVARDIKLKRYVKHTEDKILKQTLNKRGYMYVTLTKKGIQKSYRVHRIVAEAFIYNPDNKPFVNHLDYDRTNNNANNLEWCTAQENTNYSIERIRNAINNPIGKSGERYISLRKDGKYTVRIKQEYVGYFSTLAEAIKERNRILAERGVAI